MNYLRFAILILGFTFCFPKLFSQNRIGQDSLKMSAKINTTLKLTIKPFELNINSKKIYKKSHPLYIYNQMGMYEQYNSSANKTIALQPYKAYYPTSVINYNGNTRICDSFNPHGAKNIGDALINGLINGILLGKKY